MIHIPRIVGRVPILRGVARLLLSSYAMLFRDGFLIQRRMGFRLLLDQDNVVDWEVLIKGAWENEQVSFFFTLATQQCLLPHQGAIFFDIGAHWGMYSLEAHKRCLFERIIAFEPDPSNFAQLQANLFLNGLACTIESRQLAASSKDRIFGLVLDTGRNRGATRVVDVAQPHFARCIGARVDESFDFEGKLLVIKIDVEGHEIETLEGLSRLLSSNRCLVQVEADEDIHLGNFDRATALLSRHGLRHVRSIQADHYFMSEAENRPTASAPPTFASAA